MYLVADNCNYNPKLLIDKKKKELPIGLTTKLQFSM